MLFVPVQGEPLTGGMNLNDPTGGEAYGRPRNTSTPSNPYPYPLDCQGRIAQTVISQLSRILHKAHRRIHGLDKRLL